jgi:hypothetical protein
MDTCSEPTTYEKGRLPYVREGMGYFALNVQIIKYVILQYSQMMRSVVN